MTAKRNGSSLVYTNAGAALVNGDVVVMGNTIGIATQDIAATTGVGVVDIEGVHTVPKVSGAVITVGQTVIYDVSAGEFDDNAATPASGDITAGAIAVESKGAGTTTIDVKLTPGAGAVT